MKQYQFGGFSFFGEEEEGGLLGGLLGGLSPFLESGNLQDFFTDDDAVTFENARGIAQEFAPTAGASAQAFALDDPSFLTQGFSNVMAKRLANQQYQEWLDSSKNKRQRKRRSKKRLRESFLSEHTQSNIDASNQQFGSLSGLLNLFDSFQRGGTVGEQKKAPKQVLKDFFNELLESLPVNQVNKHRQTLEALAPEQTSFFPFTNEDRELRISPMHLPREGELGIFEPDSIRHTRKFQKGGKVGEKPDIYVLGHENTQDRTSQINQTFHTRADEWLEASEDPDFVIPASFPQTSVEEFREDIQELRDNFMERRGGRGTKDLTFRKEYERAGEEVLSREYNPIYIGVESGELEEALKKVPQGANIMFMDHQGSRMFGIPSNDFMDMIAAKSPNVCIGGTCHGTESFGKLKKLLPNSTVMLDDNAWEGFNPAKQGAAAIVDSSSPKPQSFEEDEFPEFPIPTIGPRQPGETNLLPEFYSPQFLNFYERNSGAFARQGHAPLIGAFRRTLSDRPEQNQKGGTVSELGYSDGSPFANRKSIDIPGNTIDMTNTSRPLQLIPNVGRPIVAPPNSGIFKFPGASNITEIPLFQLGGIVGIEAIQTEDGEVAVLPDFSVVSVKADQSHKQMDDKEVTDILPIGTFIASIDPARDISRKEAENISYGYTPLIYEEDERHNKKPEEILLSDFIFTGNEKSTKEADAVVNIKKTFPLTKRVDDPFAALAKEENRVSRQQFIEAISYINNRKKQEDEGNKFQLGGSISATSITQQAQRETNTKKDEATYIPPFMDLNIVGEGDVPKAQGGGGAGAGAGAAAGGGAAAGAAAAGSAIEGMFNFIGGLIQNAQAKKQFRQNLGYINQGAQRQAEITGLGSLLATLNTLSQNPTATTMDFENERKMLEGLSTEVDPNVVSIASSRASTANDATRQAILENTGNFSRGVNSIAGAVTAPTQTALTDLGLKTSLKNQELADTRQLQLAGFEGRQSGQRFTEGEITRTGSNALRNMLGNIGVGTTNALGVIEGNRVSNILAASGAQFAAQQQALQNMMGGIGTATGGVAGMLGAKDSSIADISQQTGNQTTIPVGTNAPLTIRFDQYGNLIFDPITK